MEGGSSLRMELDVLGVSWHATAERDQDTKHAHIHGMDLGLSGLGLEASLAEQGKCNPSQPKTVPFSLCSKARARQLWAQLHLA